MEDLFYTLLGLTAIYAWIHFLVIQHTKPYKKRTRV